MRKAASSFANEVETVLNAGKDANDKISVTYKYDAFSEVEAGQREILVGLTDRGDSIELYENLGYFSYKVITKGDNILIGAHLESNAIKGLNVLFTYIKSAYRSSIDGNCYIPSGIELSDEVDGWTDEVPNLSGGTFDEKIEYTILNIKDFVINVQNSTK